MSGLSDFLVESILSESVEQVTALFGGGFKPPTKGHLDVILNGLKQNPEINNLRIIVGGGVRDGITQDQSAEIWNFYNDINLIPINTEIIKASPFSYYKEYLKSHPEDKVYVFIGSREDDDKDQMDVAERSKFVKKYSNNVIPVEISTTGGISGTEARKLFKSDLDSFKNMLPQNLTDDDIKKVINILNNNLKKSPDVTSNKTEPLKPINEADPKKGTGKKPKGSSRRLYTDEDPKDTVGIKFSTRQDIVDTLNKKSFKAKSHARQSQIINLIHQRVRAAYGRAKDPAVKKRLKTGLDYITDKKEASKKKTQRLKNQKENIDPKSQAKHKGKSSPFGSAYEPVDEIGINRGVQGSRYRAIEKRGDKYYYIQDNPFSPGVRQEFGPYKTKAAAKRKMGTFPPAQNYRDITEIDYDSIFRTEAYLKTNISQRSQGDILSDIRSLPGVTIVGSKEVPNRPSREESILSIKVDPYPFTKMDDVSASEAVDYITNEIRKINGVERFQILKKRVSEGDTYEKMAAKGKKAGSLKQGTVRKRLKIPKDKKIPLAKINKEISRLKKMDKDKDKKGVQLGDKNQKYYKALQLSKTLKTTTNINENATYSSKIDYKQQIKDLTKHMIKKGMNILPLPKVIFKHGDQENASQFLGKTAYYDPNDMTVVLYTEGRHPKDIVRSFAHEMVHHIQNLEGRLGGINTTNTIEDDNLNDIEREAYTKGNMTFRNWTDNKDGEEVTSLNENITPIKNLKVYHSTDSKFEDFSLDYAWDGFWFTDDLNSLKNKTAGASGGKYILTRYITLKNPANWDEYEKYSVGELIDQGYDGAFLPDEGRADYLVFNPKSISKGGEEVTSLNEKNKDLFGLDAYARELVKEFQIENIKPPAKSLEEQKEVRIFTKNCDCDKT